MYYRLTYHLNGVKETVLCGNCPLDIGQTAACGIQLPEDSETEPQIFATIVPHIKGKEWYVVRRSDFADIFLNGSPLDIAAPLSGGDRLTLGGTEIQFRTFSDNRYTDTDGIVNERRNSLRGTLLISFALAAVAVAVAAVALFASGGGDQLAHANLDRYNASLFRITVDSVSLVKDTVIDGLPQTVVVSTVETVGKHAGTCFLTEDGYFVTARHCVEPWINDEGWKDVNAGSDMSPALKLATFAETENRINGDRRYRVCSHCVVSNRSGRHEYLSTDFLMDKSRDKIIKLGTDSRPMYWRTITPMATCREMELGDFAYIKCSDLNGAFSLADVETMRRFDRQADKDIAVLGFPTNDNGTNETATRANGNSQHLEYDEASGHLLGCIQMSAPINRGNSGGPVLAKVGRKIVVVGIVSKADEHATQGTFWAVPATEVGGMIVRGGEPVYDTMEFIR